MLHRRLALIHSLVALTLLVLTSPAAAGVVFEFEMEDYGVSPNEKKTVLVSAEGENLRMDILVAGRAEDDAMAILRGAEPELIFIKHSSKRYVVIDLDVLDSLASATESRIEEALENVPKEQRATVEKMMREEMGESSEGHGETTEATLEYRASGDEDTINGYPAERYDVYQGDRKTREIWVSDWKHVDGSFDILDGLQALSEFGAKLKHSMGQQGRFPLGPFTRMNELNGFPVMNRALGAEGEALSVAQLVRSVWRELAPTAFDVPVGYERQPLETSGGR